MTVAAIEQKAPARATPVLFTVAIFVSAALVFMIEPMITKMILPKLGGSSTVWNTSLAFFQGALLAGYGYAHALQRIAALAQAWLPPRGASPMPAGAPTQVVLIAKTPQALAPFAADPRWRPARDKNVRPWTDTYTNVAGALLDQLLQRRVRKERVNTREKCPLQDRT